MNLALILLSGLLMGFGLALSGMGDPANVIGFLDISRQWNPQLIFVMGGAAIVTLIGYNILKVEMGGSFKDVDTKLVAGSALFGIGWGLSGYCPGPALISLNAPTWGLIAFLASLFISTWVTKAIFK